MLLIVKQILFLSNPGNVQRVVWRICILMLECKGSNSILHELKAGGRKPRQLYS